MREFTILVDDEIMEKLKEITEIAEVTVRSVIEDFVNDHIIEAQTDLIVKLYKKGKLNATKAWKLSGLQFDEFMALAKD